MEKYKDPLDQQDDDETESGSSGQGTDIAFVDFTRSKMEIRDDLLSEADARALLSTHKDTHEARVQKQKELSDNRKDLKNGKVDLQTYRQEKYGNSNQSQFKTNPILANKAQFSGTDKQVNPLPLENAAETNNEKKQELTYQHQLRYAPSSRPTFNPKPSPL